MSPVRVHRTWSRLTISIPAFLAAVGLSGVPIVALPIVVLYMVGRRQLVTGLTAGFGR
ncbi:hypothetical protein ACFSBZ_01700 [Amnibacterium flavum]|uniref:hypothetical protein n=1 Tax=Amnibacterium flavum TaxID=2173173 RepID=UPI00140322B7|nr:hypothetical protein [Amnibacterium flavum]